MKNQDYQFIEENFSNLIKKHTKKLYEAYISDNIHVEYEDCLSDMWISVLKATESFTRIHDKPITDPAFAKYLASSLCNVFNAYTSERKKEREYYKEEVYYKDEPVSVDGNVHYLRNYTVPTMDVFTPPELTDKARAIFLLLLETEEFIDNPEFYIKARSGKLNYTRVGELLDIPRKQIERAFKVKENNE